MIPASLLRHAVSGAWRGRVHRWPFVPRVEGRRGECPRFRAEVKFPESMPPIRFTAAEFADRAALALAVDGVEIVFHLLGGTNPEVSNKDPIADLQASTLRSVQLLELCRSASVRKIVFVSSGGTVYGVPRQVPIAEDAPTGRFLPMASSKLMTEKYLQLFRHLHGLESISLRVAKTIGP